MVKKMLKLILACLTIIACVSCEKFRFDNYTLYRIVPKNEQQMVYLQKLQDSDQQYDFWTDPMPSAEFVNIMSPPLYKSSLESFLNLYDIPYKITMSNVQEAINSETITPYTRNNFRSMRWDTYYTLADIEAWMSDVARSYPQIVTELVGGESYEGRLIKGLKISHGNSNKIIFIEAGIHSREWITLSGACYIINELLTSTNAETRAVAEEFDWYIFPVTNPDGYVWTHTDFRMWRKNRRPFGSNYGVDLNRNWNNNWLVAGASTNPSSDTYAGPGPFSEPETRSLSTFIRSVGDIDLYLSFHSFSQLLLIPFGNTTEPVANYHDALNIGRRAMGALSVRYGTQYVTGNIAEAIYHATGGSVDWVKEHLQVPLVYCYEFRDRGQNGFLLPTDQILPNNEEVWDSILEMIHQAKRFGYMNAANDVTGGFAMIMITMVISFLSL